METFDQALLSHSLQLKGPHGPNQGKTNEGTRDLSRPLEIVFSA